jgi:hypothetical protein
LRKHWKLGLLTVVASGFATPAFSQNTTFTFHGTCSDCSGTATATLVLSNYTLGQAITGANFVSFTYNGTNLQVPFTITASTLQSVSGSMTTIPGANTFEVVASNLNEIEFESQVNGSWFCGLGDSGTLGTWTGAPPTTPAPPTSLLVGVGLLAFAAFGFWRRHRLA